MLTLMDHEPQLASFLNNLCVSNTFPPFGLQQSRTSFAKTTNNKCGVRPKQPNQFVRTFNLIQTSG
ncbi:MAG: hypothetical protein ACTS6G_03375 [Candidatus Hodgkinia cicadicola]